MINIPTITKHANKRWNERFNDKNFIEEWNRSRPAGKKTRKIIKNQCLKHKEIMTPSNPFYYMVTKEIVFVVIAPSTIVTVFPLNKNIL